MFKSINRTIKILVTSDFILNCGWGLLGPVFALFIAQRITGGDINQALKVAGLTAFFYWIPKSILQIPIGKYLDKNHGEKDDFLFMVIGTFLAGFVPIIFLVAVLPWHIYLAQIIHAFAMSLVIPSWMAIFTRHIDKGKEALEWGLESTSIGIGAGIAAALGGTAAAIFGFGVVFICASILTIMSAFLLILIRKDISLKKQSSHFVPVIKSPGEDINL
ncbi:MFS transporter [Patescibacteria group bacterium]|nr:MFS transporter [Patescibacteria group bacterium]MBU4367467.1 MFS transporter [Patescibacteria group bacterium]MBU4461787.1 MFS transporter [Patescibacteria group bacterium]MCG2700171.1 MFS transporter [Candidatus Parcubacteria bacterium]